MFITSDSADPVLNQPYVDRRESGATTDPITGVTVSYLYVHGGFTGTDARFAFYFPAASLYQGRFFQHTYPTVSTEEATPDVIAFAISNGAYVVSSNNAGGVPAGGELAAYRANAAAAQFSRDVAREVYGCTITRPRGYIYGASGGAYQTIGALENTNGVWEGGVPMVFGVPNSIPSFQTVELLALRVLADKLPQIADAVAPGGTGDPYAGLSQEQEAVLREATAIGFPLRGWWQHATLSGGAFFAVQGGVRAIDPSYVNDFWNLPGYEGRDPTVQAARFNCRTTVTGLAGTSGLVLAEVPAGGLSGADLDVTSGPLAGRTVPILSVTGNAVEIPDNPGITPGTTVELDNSWLIALQYYQRHQVPTPDEYGWAQYRSRDGAPLQPQRPVLVGSILAANAAGSVPTGRFYGKMIMLGSTMDVEAYPWGEDWYKKKAESALGTNFSNSFRLWYMDNADHDPKGPAATNAADAASHIVSYAGEMQQALLDLDGWVAHAQQPPNSTSYRVSADSQVQLPATAKQRRGLQPVVTLSASAGAGTPAPAIIVGAGQPVTFSMSAEVPFGAGEIVRVEWDYAGSGTFDVRRPLTSLGPTVSFSETYTYTQPGTYFPVVRVASHRNGDSTTPYGLIQNLAAVRVVVE